MFNLLFSFLLRKKTPPSKSRPDGIVLPAYHPFLPGFDGYPLLAICAGASQQDLSNASSTFIEAATEILHLVHDRQSEHIQAVAGVLLLLEIGQAMLDATLINGVPDKPVLL